MVTKITKADGIPTHISPHSLRHAAITNALDAGCPFATRRPSPATRAPAPTEHYDHARGNRDRHAVHFLTADVAGV